MALVPYVIEQTSRGGERSYDIYSRLFKERIITEWLQIRCIDLPQIKKLQMCYNPHRCCGISPTKGGF